MHELHKLIKPIFLVSLAIEHLFEEFFPEPVEGSNDIAKDKPVPELVEGPNSEEMSTNYIESKIFSKTNFAAEPLPKGEYENCTFSDCDLSGCDLSGCRFIGCSFTGCNVSLAKISNSAFQEVQFKGSKLMGVHFENCNTFLFSIYFDHCTLNLSSFYKLNLKRSSFRDCALQEVDFTEAYLSGRSFDNCDLAGAIFENSNLEKTDFRAAYNYTIDPELNRMKKARFSMPGVAGLLGKYGIEIE